MRIRFGVRLGRPRHNPGFTLIELLVVVAIIGVLASWTMASVGRAKASAHASVCINNNQQLTLAWLLYADDNDWRLAYNLGGDATRHSVARKNPLNWVNGVMSWELDPDNTNVALLAESGLGPYVAASPTVYKCPSDHVLSDVQKHAGWTERIRSYSMNAMVGDAGELSVGGTNVNNPDYQQFFLLTAIPDPGSLFIMLDEHPDSIDDGYFLNRPDDAEWVDLPASYHNGACSLSFADGHVELHRWLNAQTKPPALPDAAPLPVAVSASARVDFDWLAERTSVER